MDLINISNEHHYKSIKRAVFRQTTAEKKRLTMTAILKFKLTDEDTLEKRKTKSTQV